MTGPGVRLQVGEAAVAAIAAAAATAVAGVVPGVSATVTPDPAELDVRIATRLGDNCRDVAAAVQQAVTAEVTEQTGLVMLVRVTVAEILWA